MSSTEKAASGGGAGTPVRLTVAIPCHNEEAIIEDTYRRVKDTCEAQGATYEIIFGDDCSTDRTLGMLEGYAAADPCVRVTTHNPNRGAGFTYREMYGVARGEVIIQMDADLAMPPEVAVPAFMAALERADVVVGSRYAGIRPDYPLKRRIFSRGYIMLTHLLFDFDIRDTQSGSIGFHRRVLERMDLRSDGFEILLEFIVQAAHAGFTMEELGLPWFHDTSSGEVEVFRKSMTMFASTMRVRRRLGRGAQGEAAAIKGEAR